MYLVIGATAHFGRETVEELAATNVPVRALTRTPEKAALPDGIDVVRGDLTRPETLPPAFAGVEAALVILQYGMDVSPLLAAARAAGVRRLVFLSSGAIVAGAEPQTDVIARYHRDVERAIEASGIDWTFLRLLFPAINSLTFAMQTRSGDVIRAPYTGAAFSAVHERDVAAVAARILTSGGHTGRVYDLTGPESLTQAQQVRILGETLGRALTVEDLDPAPVLEQMSRFMDGEFLAALFRPDGGGGRQARAGERHRRADHRPARADVRGMGRGPPRRLRRLTVPRTWGRRALGRALLARQMLLERADVTAEEAITRLVGMQAQAPYAPYFGLWSRLRRFGVADLADGLNDRRLVRIALMRSTIHLVTAADYRLLRPWAQPALDRELNTAFKSALTGLDRAAVAEAGRALLGRRNLTPGELGMALNE